MPSTHNGYKTRWIGDNSDQFAIVAINVKINVKNNSSCILNLSFIIYKILYND